MDAIIQTLQLKGKLVNGDWNWKWTLLWIFILIIVFLVWYDYGNLLIDLLFFLTGGDRA